MPLERSIGNAYTEPMNEAVERFIKHANVGSQDKAAELLGVKQPTVSEWLREIRPVPHETCADMERISGGDIQAELIRHDARWLRVKDRTWKWHPAGKPVLDVARVA